MSRSSIILYVSCIVLLITMLTSKHHLQSNVLKWDVAAYYTYLPATFIYKDLKTCKFYDEIDQSYRPSDDRKRYGLQPSPIKNNVVNKYTCGVAVFEMPFYFLAHAYTGIFNTKHEHNGFSVPFQFMVALSNIFFVVLGLWFLMRFLRQFYSDSVVAWVIAIISLGTNLFFYTGYIQGMSHGYLFFCYATVLFLTERWFRLGQQKDFYCISLLCGIAFMTRPTDLFLVFIPLLWNIDIYKNLRVFWKTYSKPLLIGILVFIFPSIIQMGYWKYVTNQWIFYSYTGEGFDFLHPHIIEGLFSYKKGWFVYTPLALLGFLGIVQLSRDRKKRFYILPFIVYYTISLYIIFSWECWWYGGSFGSRPMIQSLALLALPMGSLLQSIINSIKWAKVSALVLIILCIGLNQVQSWQYNHAIIHWDKMTKAYYWKVFGKTEFKEEWRELLK